MGRRLLPWFEHEGSRWLTRVAEIGRRCAAIAVGCAFLAAGLGFEGTEPTERRVPASCAYEQPLSVVLIAIDGVRWQDVFIGTDPRLAESPPANTDESGEQLTPNIHALARRGVALGAPDVGEPFSASGPNFVSLPGYAELLQGRPADCQENDCESAPTFTLLDAFSNQYDPERAVAFSSWTNIERVAGSKQCNAIVSAGRTGGATRQTLFGLPEIGPLVDHAAAAPTTVLGGDYRADSLTIDIALRYLDLQKPRFMFVSLGDTDEHAHHRRYGAYLDALRRADDFVGEVMRIADDWRDDGMDTLVIVTTDHGRADDFEHHGRDYPESARGWLVAAGGPVPARGFVASPTRRYLRDIAPTIAALAGLPLDIGPSSGTILTELAPACAEP
ncbi:MAG: hypothetical protein HOW73_12285 [Polyangiaceae bacterium]|nr:hypothetical protein [Polyangiaceae bacterium]